MNLSWPPVFKGNERFSITRELGRGGMGVVYEAYDSKRGETVALKTLHWTDASAIYRFKSEFRALADVAHRNLVHLYELVARDDTWFFTMELVDGVDFLRHVRPGWNPALSESDGSTVDSGGDVPNDPMRQRHGELLGAGVLEVPRLRAALRQLAEGVAALHQAGKLHRDLKPSNVMVTGSGRVVIVDFGIAAEFGSAAPLQTVEQGHLGTVEYMAPEQCADEPSTPASDWYSVGVLLYEALTATLPFAGSALRVLTQKQVCDPPRPDNVARALPEDLVDLCVRLLTRAPAGRPSDPEVLSRVGVAAPPVVIGPHSRPAEDAVLIGRASHLAALEHAFAAAESGQTVSLCVQGPSGIGKSSLVCHFTDGLVRVGRAVVLAGRCSLRESVPYKALDGVIDMLSRLLKRLPDDLVEAGLPQDCGALARVFPVLGRVEAVERRASAAFDIPDRLELRRRAFAALGELLARISQERPVVLHIDDLQWADRESADVLEELLRSPEPQRLLYILSFRSEEVTDVPLLQSLLSQANTPTRRALDVGPLSAADAVEFAWKMLATQLPNAGAYAQKLARESDGNPFLIDQMVRYVLEADRPEEATSFGLGTMLNARLRQMPEGARPLVDVLAVASQPIDAEAAYRAAGLMGDERPLVTSLRIAHLLRATSTGERIEFYHDRIREHHTRQLSVDATRSIHLRLAESLEAKGIDDPEALYEHYLGAGEETRAALYAARAAERAQTALAFERAAQFYERALELAADTGKDTESWYVGLGDALASSGRGGEAARAYLQAAATAGEGEALKLERLAGEQFLISGRIDEGLEVLGRVLAKVGLKLAPSPRRALLSLLLRRARVRLRGLGFRERSVDEIPVEVLTRIDVCWAVAEGLAMMDTIQGAAFQALHLVQALKAGEPNRIARALAIEAGFTATAGAAGQASRLLGEAERLARQLDSPYAHGLCMLMNAVVAFHAGRCDRAVELVQEAERMLSDQLSFVAWQLSTAKIYHIHILAELGEVAELCRLSRKFLQEALDRGNLLAETIFRTGWSSLVWLNAGDLAGARKALQEALPGCPTGTFHISHYECMLAQTLIDLYAGEGEAALHHITEVWPRLEKSMLLRIETIRVECVHLRAMCALAAANAGRKRERLLRAVERDARRIERERNPRWQGRAALIRAGIETSRGRHPAVLHHLTTAIDGFNGHHMALWHAVSVRRKGELLRTDEGRALIAEADAWMAAQGTANPERMTAMLAPGFPTREETG